MPAWYDIRGNDLMDDGGKRDEDASGLERSRESILAMLRGETDAGLPSERIVLGGFSQGSAGTAGQMLLVVVKGARIPRLDNFDTCDPFIFQAVP